MKEYIKNDDFYSKKNMSTGYHYNTSYIGHDIKDNSMKPSAPRFSIGKAPKDPINKYFGNFKLL